MTTENQPSQAATSKTYERLLTVSSALIILAGVFLAYLGLLALMGGSMAALFISSESSAIVSLPALAMLFTGVAYLLPGIIGYTKAKTASKAYFVISGIVLLALSGLLMALYITGGAFTPVMILPGAAAVMSVLYIVGGIIRKAPADKGADETYASMLYTSSVFIMIAGAILAVMTLVAGMNAKSNVAYLAIIVMLVVSAAFIVPSYIGMNKASDPSKLFFVISGIGMLVLSVGLLGFLLLFVSILGEVANDIYTPAMFLYVTLFSMTIVMSVLYIVGGAIRKEQAWQPSVRAPQKPAEEKPQQAGGGRTYERLLNASSVVTLIAGMLFAVILMVASATASKVPGGYGNLVTLGVIVLLAFSAVYLTLSIIGIKLSKNHSSKLYFIIAGAVLLVQSVLFFVSCMAAGTFNVMMILMLVSLGVMAVMSVLYIIGGIVRKPAIA